MPTKIYTFSLCCLLLLLNVNATFSEGNDPNIVWDRTEHDFGEVIQGEIVEIGFTVSNNGKDTLIVENAVGSCGCIASSWPHQPIFPGKKASVTVKFDTNGKSGNQMKSVSVYTNKGAYYLSLKANIIKK